MLRHSPQITSCLCEGADLHAQLWPYRTPTSPGTPSEMTSSAGNVGSPFWAVRSTSDAGRPLPGGRTRPLRGMTK